MVVSTGKLNDFPERNGMTGIYSPNEIMGHETHEGTGDYLCECGRRVGVKNNLCMETHEAIYLRRNYDIRNGYIVMELRTGSEVIQSHANPIPLTFAVKERVEQLAEKDNIGELRFCMREGQSPVGIVKYWHAGVRTNEIEGNETIGPVGIPLPMPIRTQRTTENNNLSEGTTEQDESSDVEQEDEDSMGEYPDPMENIPESDEEKEESNDSNTDC